MLEAGCATARVIDGAPSPTGTSVYLVSHGWHVGLVLRRGDVSADSWPEKEALGPVRYLEVGWGDGDYYPAPRGTTSLALRAAFRSRSSVLQVVGFNDPVAEMFPRSKILEVELSPDGAAALSRYIHRSYARGHDGRPIIVAPAQYGFGLFYAAREQYRLFDNSNTWAAKALRAAGCPIDAEATLTAGMVLHQAVHFARVVRPGVFVHQWNHVRAHCR